MPVISTGEKYKQTHYGKEKIVRQYVRQSREMRQYKALIISAGTKLLKFLAVSAHFMKPATVAGFIFKMAHY